RLCVDIDHAVRRTAVRRPSHGRHDVHGIRASEAVMGKWSAPSFQLPVASKWRRHPPARAANCQPPTGNWQSARAFTLTELMIAIALVIILAVGVAQVFQMTSQTVSSGQALQPLTRDARAAESVFSNDIQSMVTHTDQPALIIWSQRNEAFLNEHDRLSDEDD